MKVWEGRRHSKGLVFLVFVIIVFGIGWLLWRNPAVYGAQLQTRQLLMSDNTPSAVSQDELSFQIQSPGSFGSVRVDFCANDALIQDICTPPSGFSLHAASLASQTGVSGFSISPASTANELILSRTPLPVSAGPVSFTFKNVTNPSATGAYFTRIQTYASSDASGPASDYGSIAFDILNSLAISAEVPPYLFFCSGITIANINCSNASGDYIDFGELSSNHAVFGSSQMVVATNAASGYDITMNGTTLESGNDIINALSSADVSRPGTAQFGMNLRANSSPTVGADPTGPGLAVPESAYDQSNFYQFNSGDVLVSYPKPDNSREFTASYIVNVPKTQAAGVYVSTITYVCLATF